MVVVNSDDNCTAIMCHDNFEGEARLVLNNFKDSKEGNGCCIKIGENGAEIIFDGSVLKKLVHMLDSEECIDATAENDYSPALENKSYIEFLVFDAPAVINVNAPSFSKANLVKDIEQEISSNLKIVYICKLADLRDYQINTKSLYHMYETSDGIVSDIKSRDCFHGRFNYERSKFIQHVEVFEDRDLLIINDDVFTVVDSKRLDSHGHIVISSVDTCEIIQNCDFVIFETRWLYEGDMRDYYDRCGIDLRYIGEISRYIDELKKKEKYKSFSDQSDGMPKSTDVVVHGDHMYITTNRE